MDFAIPAELEDYYAELEAFIENTIEPMVARDDNIRFFDHRREDARTDWDRGGLPSHDWEELLRECRRAADEAGHWRFSAPKKYGGQDGSNLWMAVIRDRFAQRGLGLHNDLQNEHSIVGNFPFVAMFETNGGPRRKSKNSSSGGFNRHPKGRVRAHGTGPRIGRHPWMETTAVRETRNGVDGWLINGEKMWITGMHVATHCAMFARTSGENGEARAASPASSSPIPRPGLEIEEWMWTFNMPTDHPRLSVTNVWVPDSAILGVEGRGLALAQSFVHQNRIRQAASSLGAAQYCVEESVRYARERKPFGEELAKNQAIQFPLVELATQCEMLRLLIYKTAWEMDNMAHEEIEKTISEKVSMCNYWANRLVCEAADRAMQVHGGIGYSRHKPFEHIYRHHRRYRITEGAEEIQMRKVAAYLFGYLGPRRGSFART